MRRLACYTYDDVSIDVRLRGNRGVCLVFLVALGALLVWAGRAPTAAHARVWHRTLPDGTVEFTNVRPKRAQISKPSSKAAGGWRPTERNPQSNDGVAAAKPVVLAKRDDDKDRRRSKRRAATRAFWVRENADGTVEYTNIKPIGGRWKVLFKTGPGKAQSTRGKTDRVPAKDHSPERFSRYDKHIQDQYNFYGIPPALVRAVIKTESDFDPNVVSSVGAQGLMQLMPATGREMGVLKPLIPGRTSWVAPAISKCWPSGFARPRR